MDDTVPALVIENGSSCIKAGFAGDDEPKVVFPAVVAAENVYMADLGSKNLTFKYPIERGLVTDWDDMEKLWHHVFNNELRAASEEYPILLTETPLNPKADREKMTQLMFETFKTPAMYVALKPVLPIYASGRLTGIVFQSGDSVSYAVPIYEGYALPHAVRRMDLAGRDLTHYVSQLIQGRGYDFRGEQDIARDIKEKLCYATYDFYNGMETISDFSTIEKSYELPDGSSVTVGAVRIKTPQCMFQPTLIGKNIDGAHETIYKSIKACDDSISRDILRSIILAGGNTMFPDFDSQMHNAIFSLTYLSWLECLHKVYKTGGKYSTWIGGSIMGSISLFQDMCISKAEYDEYGPSIVHKKCF